MTDNKDRFKFRFFENKTKILHQVREINFVENTIFIIGGGAKFCKDGTLIQSTSLKDKNGKLMYEGDIVKCKVTEDYKIVEYVAEIVYNDSDYRFDLKVKKESPYHPLIIFFGKKSVTYPNEIEVIGNKFENPELLKRPHKIRPSKNCSLSEEHLNSLKNLFK